MMEVVPKQMKREDGQWPFAPRERSYHMQHWRVHETKSACRDRPQRRPRRPRRVREEWEMDGSVNYYDRCKAKAKEVIESYEVEPLPSDVRDQIRAIVSASEKKAGVAAS